MLVMFMLTSIYVHTNVQVIYFFFFFCICMPACLVYDTSYSSSDVSDLNQSVVENHHTFVQVESFFRGFLKSTFLLTWLHACMVKVTVEQFST